MREKLQDNSTTKHSAGVLSLGQLLQQSPAPAPALIEPGLLPASGILFVGGEPKLWWVNRFSPPTSLWLWPPGLRIPNPGRAARSHLPV